MELGIEERYLFSI